MTKKRTKGRINKRKHFQLVLLQFHVNEIDEIEIMGEVTLKYFKHFPSSFIATFTKLERKGVTHKKIRFHRPPLMPSI